ncbi:MAG: zinc-binding dehydrogenase [Bryobacterales bacterium]|nr:zinc-binding dehydrogenase [Bryobacterales bacterium]
MAQETSAVVVKPGKMELREFSLPAIGPEDALLRVEMVSICGSDRHHFVGGAYGVFPKILGHELVGFVESIGEQAAAAYGVNVGDRVVVEPYIPCWLCRYCATGYYQLCPRRRIYGVNISCETPPYLWGAYGQYMYIASGSRVHKIGRHVSPQAATLSSVIGNGVRWIVTKGKLRPGEAVAIVGPGALGIASTIVASVVGAAAIIVVGRDSDEARLQFARECGATYCIPVEQSRSSIVDEVREICGGELPRLSVDASGTTEGITTALSLVRPAGTCVISGATGMLTPINTDAIVRGEIQVLGGLGQSWDVEAAVKIIEGGTHPIDKMVGCTYPLADAELALKHFIHQPRDYIRIGLNIQ